MPKPKTFPERIEAERLKLKSLRKQSGLTQAAVTRLVPELTDDGDYGNMERPTAKHIRSHLIFCDVVEALLEAALKK